MKHFTLILIALITFSCALNKNQGFQRLPADDSSDDINDLRQNEFNIEGVMRNTSGIKDIGIYLSYTLIATKDAFWGDCTEILDERFEVLRSKKIMVKVDPDLDSGTFKKNIVVEPGRCNWRLSNVINVNLFSPLSAPKNINQKEIARRFPHLRLYFHEPESTNYGSDMEEFNSLKCIGKNGGVACNSQRQKIWHKFGLISKERMHILNIDIE